MHPKTCDSCGKVFSTKFCPDCGRAWEDVIISKPVTIKGYSHGSKESGYDLCEKHGINPKSKLGEAIIYMGYEVEIIYEIVGNKLVAKQVNVGDEQGLCDIVPIKK